MTKVIDPLRFKALFWPDVRFYREQKQVIYSVANDDEVYVPAGNKLGKDFVSAFIALWFFCSRHPCRIITTSTKDEHLDVLWGEIGRFIQTAKYPLDSRDGGPLVINHHEIRKMVGDRRCPISYLKGMVASNDSIQSFQGHHVTPDAGTQAARDGLPRTLFIGDKATSLKDEIHKMVRPWAKRILCIGNPWPSENFFKRAVRGRRGTKDVGGNLPRDNGKGYHRRVIQIKAEYSPNVRFALAQIARGIEPTNEVIVPGVIDYQDYLKARKLWDPIQQMVSLDAEFPEGSDNYLLPADWLSDSASHAETLPFPRKGKTMGVDSAMGGDNTAWAICDDLGLLELVSKKTPNTSDIPKITLALANKWGVPAHQIYFDYGGGGKQHVDRLREKGYRVNAVTFGTPASPEKRHGVTPLALRKEQDAVRYAYKNRRAEMYGTLRLKIDPAYNEKPFGLPARLLDQPRGDNGPSLLGQLSPLPLWYDEEGRLFLPPKKRRADAKTTTTKVTLDELLGCSPDEADALVLSVYGLTKKSNRPTAGAISA